MRVGKRGTRVAVIHKVYTQMNIFEVKNEFILFISLKNLVFMHSIYTKTYNFENIT
jgi:hypothetical protein